MTRKFLSWGRFVWHWRYTPPVGLRKYVVVPIVGVKYAILSGAEINQTQFQMKIVTKASLLAGVGFALAMNWGQTRCSCHDLSGRTGFGAPGWTWFNHVELWPPPPRGLKPRCVHPAGSIPLVVSFATTRSHPHAHRYTRWYSSWVLWM